MARDLTATQVYVGSTPITLSNWDHSSGVEHLLDTQRVVGSNPSGPTICASKMYYKTIDNLPKIPKHLEEYLLELAENDDAFLKDSVNTAKFYNRSEMHDQIQTFPKISLINTKAENWLKDSIHANAKYYQLIKNIDLGKSFWPHVDRTRKFTLIYLLQTGGDPQTVFYRTKDNSEIYPAQTWSNYENLVEVDRIRIPIKTWTLLRADVPHSVEDMSGHRISVQMSFDEDILSS